jgi:hypothetical protein
LKNKQWFTPVRFSHLTGHAGVGSIVRDQNDYLLFVKDTSTWPVKNLTKLHAVERVKRHLEVSSNLVLPPEASIDETANLKLSGGAIPTVRFPNWALCNLCNTLHLAPWKNSSVEICQKLKCPSCNKGTLSQVTWCAVSSYGDLIDVPWHYIGHRNPKNDAQTHCRSSSNESYLKLELNERGRWEVQCKKCGAKNSLEMTDFQRKVHKQPGYRERKSLNGEVVTYTVMEVNDPRVFSSVSERALVIPPESNIDKTSLFFRLTQQSQLVAGIKDAKRPLQKKREVKKAMRELKCSEEELFSALEEIDRGDLKDAVDFSNITPDDMMFDEFEALTTIQKFNNNADFITSHLTSEWSDYLDSLSESGDIRPEVNVIDKLIAVNRLRVIEVYKGFQRAASDAEDFDPTPIVAPDFTGNLDWLPAIELFGEGMFFTLNNEIIEKWEHHPLIRQRASEIETRYQDSEIILPDEAIPTPRFILLHTLAHALVRELESIAGYPAASLQERIYSSAEKKMAGVLIYTAVPDIAGSLGGIIEQAKPRRFIKLLDSAFKQLEWCSMDPVCGDMEGQGPSWLNRAACHGCVLLPDTSCSYNNVFLDRVFIKGKPDEGIPSLKEFVKK